MKRFTKKGFLPAFCAVLLIVTGCSDSEKSNPVTPQPEKTVCISVSGTRVTINQFWRNGNSHTFTFNGESGSTNEVTNLETGEKITVRFSNIRYAGFSVSSFNASLNGGPHTNKSISYPANKCN